jgi:hypothetical protein
MDPKTVLYGIVIGSAITIYFLTCDRRKKLMEKLGHTTMNARKIGKKYFVDQHRVNSFPFSHNKKMSAKEQSDLLHKNFINKSENYKFDKKIPNMGRKSVQRFNSEIMPAPEDLLR